MSVDGSRLFVWATDSGTGTTGLKVFDITNPLSPSITGSVTGLDYVYELAVVESRVFSAASRQGLRIFDVAEPSAPVLSPWYFGLPGYAGPAAAGESYAYVISYGGGGLQVLDISDPSAPLLAATQAVSGTGHGLCLDGSRVLWVGTAGGSAPGGQMTIVDVGDPDHPSILGGVSLPSFASDVAVAGPFAFAITGIEGVLTVDISDPAEPALVGACDIPGYTRSIAIAWPLAYVGSTDFYILDLEDPASPQTVGFVDTPGFAEFVAIADGLAFAADPWAGVSVIDVSEPTAPVLVGSLATPGGVRALDYAAPYLYVADTMAGVMVVDVSEPSDPRVIGLANLPSPPTDFAVAGSVIFVSAGEAGVYLASADCGIVAGAPDPMGQALPGAPLVRVYPNPFNPMTTVYFTLDRPQLVQVAVHDLSGRLVRVLAEGRQEAGTHEVSWQGTDGAGRAMPSGTYLLRVKSEQDVQSQKITLVR